MTTYSSPYTGQTINPSQVGYEALTISTNTTLQWPINSNSSNVVANIIDVIATANGLQLILPPALEVSVGQAFIVRNIGNGSQYSFTVANNSGGTIQTIPVAPTTSTVNTYYIYLTDNTTINGSWSTIALGIGTSAYSASALAGYGLEAINNTLNTVLAVNQFASNYTLNSQDQSSLYVWTGGAGTVTLPQAATVGASWYAVLKNDGTGILNVVAQGTSTIDFTSTSAQLQLGESFVVTTDGTNWYTYAYGQSAQFFFTLLSLPVTGGTVTLTSVQASSIIQEYTGTLTSNCTIILPPTVQFYSLQNNTSGSFSLTFSTGVVGGTTITLPQGQTIIAICDGTNVYNAQTSTSSFIQNLKIGNGSAAAPSLAFQSNPSTGLYLAASGQIGFAISGLAAGQLTATGLLLPVGINGGAF